MGGKYIIVDKNDNQIAVKEKKDILNSDIYRVSALWLTNNKGEILIAQRSLNKMYHPGKWQPAVAGTVEDGESYEQNMIKEIREELGLKRLRIIIGPKNFSDGEYKFFRQLYMAQADIQLSDISMQEDEVKAVKWIKKQDLIDDVKANPDQYVPSMAEVMQLIYPEFKYL